ncbi:MAG: response regulator transcription factor [Moraxellaceae bacterium]|nr:response regulator transcription factor [Moraxellaceae bacterium]
MTAPTRHAAASTRGILVVDDHDLVRLGLRTLVQSHVEGGSLGEQGVTVWEARTLRDAMVCYRERSAEIGLVLLDLHLPDTQGLSGLGAFVSSFPDARVVVLSGDTDPALVRQALARGAAAFLPKSGDLRQVIDYIAALGMFDAGREGGLLAGPHVGPQSARSALPAGTAQPPGLQHATPLTPRQAEVLEWILSGLSNREIAERAHLSEGTVKNHVSALLLQFGVRSRAQLISLLR